MPDWWLLVIVCGIMVVPFVFASAAWLVRHNPLRAMLPMDSDHKSILAQYVKAVGGMMWLYVGSFLALITGVVTDFLGYEIPAWGRVALWLAVVGGLIVCPFMAFRKVAKERDQALLALSAGEPSIKAQCDFIKSRLYCFCDEIATNAVGMSKADAEAILAAMTEFVGEAFDEHRAKMLTDTWQLNPDKPHAAVLGALGKFLNT